MNYLNIPAQTYASKHVQNHTPSHTYTHGMPPMLAGYEVTHDTSFVPCAGLHPPRMPTYREHAALYTGKLTGVGYSGRVWLWNFLLSHEVEELCHVDDSSVQYVSYDNRTVHGLPSAVASIIFFAARRGFSHLQFQL